jgi:peroxiredoxin
MIDFAGPSAVMRALLLLTCATALASSPEDKASARPAIGAKVADFTLPNIDGQGHSLYGYKDKKAVVVVFVGTECPIANLYLPSLVELDKKYAGKGIQFLAINSNDQDTPAEVSAHARERKLPFPVLKDADHKAADALGARRTPEVIVLDAGHVIRYRGRIDDQYGYRYRRPAPTRTELKDALEDLLAGKPIATPESEVQGCAIGRDKR